MANVVSLPSGISIPRYTPAAGLWVITCYYNPCRYKTRRKNFDLFMSSMRQSEIPILVVECAFGDEPFELPDSLDTIKVRASSLLWQKERLLNLAASWLPKDAKATAWLDCDILFKNKDWAVDTMRLLETHPIVQMFETCLRLDEKNIETSNSDRVQSFGAIAPNNFELISCGRYDRHGHTGYGWCMHREIFDYVGLYEYSIGGSADHYMAHAIYNTYGFCVENSLKNNQMAIQHLTEWGERFNRETRGELSVVPGEIVHLWHGELKNRRYLQRMLETGKLRFNPYTDVVAKAGKPLEWRPEMNKPGLKEYFETYFQSRREDG